ncbi:unnamed protein product [Adineta ricciae]|uniref:Uncharacterized protein n=1 Tax=Adineta ricciae TaxID=249248 RepID=A0A816AF79_ADIRI|nr:unnamed protein product [Adineta ricciae]CAF1596884.1 unnamed protein product [Adineta ricciae]
MVNGISARMRHMIEPNVLTETLYALVIGEKGAGKTTLVSGLYKLHPVDRRVLNTIEKKDNYYPICQQMNSVVLIDGSEEENVEQIWESTEISVVFLVIKYDTRFERMLTSYFTNEEQIEKHSAKVIVMFSHWDHSKDPEKEFEDICEFFEEECSNILNLICYSDQNMNEELVDMIFRCISHYNPKTSISTKDELSSNTEQENIETVANFNGQNQFLSQQSSDHVCNLSIENSTSNEMGNDQTSRTVRISVSIFMTSLKTIYCFYITSHPYLSLSNHNRTEKL